MTDDDTDDGLNLMVRLMHNCAESILQMIMLRADDEADANVGLEKLHDDMRKRLAALYAEKKATWQ